MTQKFHFGEVYPTDTLTCMHKEIYIKTFIINFHLVGGGLVRKENQKEKKTI